MATNRFKIRRGSSIPSTANLESFELGYVTGNGRLYINANGTMRQVGGTVSQAAVSSSSTHDQIPTALAVYNYGNGAFLKLTGGTMTGPLILNAALQVASTGSGVTPRAQSTHNLLCLGTNLDFQDTVANWSAQGFGWAWYTTATVSSVTNKPTTYGFLMNLPITGATEAHQLYFAQNHGAIYHRGGNASGWGGDWKEMWDSTNLPIPLALSKGGTGQTSAAGIRNAIGLGNTTGALPIANGGTGRTDGKVAALATPRKIGSADFDGSASITLAQMGALPTSGAETLFMHRNNDNTTIRMQRSSLGDLAKSCYIMATNAGFEFIARDKNDASNQLQLAMRDPVSRTSINQALEFGRTVGGVTNWYQVYHTGMTNIVSKAQGGLGANVSDWNNLRNAIGVQMRSGQTSVGTSGTAVTWSALGGAPQLITVTPNGHGGTYQATVSGLSASGMTINAAHSSTTVRWCVIYFP